MYNISGDNVSWRPQRVYSENGRTYVVFARPMQFGTAPAILGLANDGGWFSSPTEMMLRYRFVDNDAVIDGVVDRAALVIGVGGSQQRVEFRRVQQ